MYTNEALVYRGVPVMRITPPPLIEAVKPAGRSGDMLKFVNKIGIV